MKKRLLALALSLALICGLLAACAPTADVENETPEGENAPGQTETNPPEQPGIPPEEEDAPKDIDEQRVQEILTWLEGITDNQGVSEGDVESSLTLFAQYLVEYAEAFSGGVPLEEYYKRAVLEYQPVVNFVRIRLFYPDYPMVDAALEGCDSLYIGDDGLADTGASGHYDSDYAGVVGQTEDALLFYRGKTISCPLELEWCTDDSYKHWDKELVFHDFATERTAVIIGYGVGWSVGGNLSKDEANPDGMAYQNGSFAFEREADGGYYISFFCALPHSDQGFESKGFFERLDPVYVEHERRETGN